MSEFTPTTEELRAGYQSHIISGKSAKEKHDEFDRWLAEERRAAAEKAWDEGRAFGYKDAQGYHALGDGCGPDEWDCNCENPYRAKETKA